MLPKIFKWLTSLTLLAGSIANHATVLAAQPRVVQYWTETIFPKGSTNRASLLPLINSTTGYGGFATDILMATFFIQTNGTLTFGDVPPTDPIFDWVWDEMKTVQDAGVHVSMMLFGNWSLLDGDSSDSFEKFYLPIHDELALHGFDGIDLDIEDLYGYGGNPSPAISLAGTARLIRRLRADFGPDFIITLAPVASALSGGGTLSNFGMHDLEAEVGADINWYNAQFYSGFGSLDDTTDYEAVIAAGWTPDRVVAVMLTSSIPGSGFVELDAVAATLKKLVKMYPKFGGVDGWDYVHALPGGEEAPWKWAKWAGTAMGIESTRSKCKR
jgi:hypothetical protein